MNNYILGFDIKEKYLNKWMKKNHVEWNDRTQPLSDMELPRGWEIVRDKRPKGEGSEYYINLSLNTNDTPSSGSLLDILTQYDQSDIKGARKLARELKSYSTKAEITLPYTEEYVTVEDIESYKKIEVKLEREVIIGWPLDYDITRRWLDQKNIKWYDARCPLNDRHTPVGWSIMKTMTNGDPWQASLWLQLVGVGLRPSLHDMKIYYETEYEEAREFARKLGSSQNEAGIIVTTNIDDSHWISIDY